MTYSSGCVIEVSVGGNYAAGENHKKMNNKIGVDHMGEWTAAQYAIDAGWDFTCIEAVASMGVSSADAESLTARQ